jgi:DNA mismatch repair protein MutS
MVEMVELAHILNHATARSLVILDEIGRGTSTFDGMSVASSALSYLHEKIKPRMIFATHYHELTDLEQKHDALKNAHMTVCDHPKLTFLYEIKQGRSSKSFGIQVAELAGLPKPVIKEAWKVLKELESHSSQARAPTSDINQLSLFDATAEPVPPLASEPLVVAPSMIEQELAGLNINELRPIDAIKVLSDWQDKMKSASLNS